MFGKLSLVSLVSIALAIPSFAQVPPGHGIRFTSANGPIIEFVNVSGGGTTTQVTGMSSALQSGIRDGRIDPVTGELFVVLQNGLNDELRRVSLAGSAVTGEIVVAFQATVAGTSGWSSLDFDRNGNIFMTDGKAISRWDRATGAAALWHQTPGFPGVMTGLAIDPARRNLWASTTSFSGRVLHWKLSVPPIAGAAIFTTSAFDNTQTNVGVDDLGNVYVTTVDTGGGSVLVYKGTSGTVTAIPGAPPISLSDARYDPTRSRLHLVGSGDGAAVPSDDDYYLLNPASGFLAQLTSVSFPGSPTAVDVNDLLDTTRAFPLELSSASGATLEAAAHGAAGDVAGIGIVAINSVPIVPILIGTGICDGGGFFDLSLPVASGLTIGSTFSLQTARYSFQTGGLIFGDVVVLTVVP